MTLSQDCRTQDSNQFFNRLGRLVGVKRPGPQFLIDVIREAKIDCGVTVQRTVAKSLGEEKFERSHMFSFKGDFSYGFTVRVR